MNSPEQLSYGRCLGNAANAIRVTKLASEGMSDSAIDTAAEIFDRVLEPGCGLKLVENAGHCTALCVRISEGNCGLLQQTEDISDVIVRLTPDPVSA